MKYLLPSFFCLVACSSTKLVVNPSQAIDYANHDHWAALPGKKDPSDLSPSGLFTAADSAVDVFFLYPTSFLSKKDKAIWNAPIDYKKTNALTDATAIKYQASIFNQVGRVFAPRYRQAHYHAYFTKDRTAASKAFELAYSDVKNAFEFYLAHYNQGRPMIIAGHSQGSTHGMRLLKEFFDQKPLRQQLVVAYLPGMPIPIDFFNDIPVCNSADDLRCINSWRTFKKGYIPKYVAKEKPAMITNPISWSTDSAVAGKEQNKGALFRKFENGIRPGKVDAQINKNILWVHKPKFPGSIFYWSNNFHIADFNFFYLDVQQNAIHRTALFMQANK